MDPMMMDDNILTLTVIDLLFQFVEVVLNLFTNVLLPGILTPLFEAIFGLFAGTPAM